jgi:uncharacterized hydrophobic protein (TIGR00271 family)
LGETTRLLFDPELVDEVQEKILPLFQADAVDTAPYRFNALPTWEEDDLVVTYLNDADLCEIIPLAAQRSWRLGLLPHPDMKQARDGYGVCEKLEEALADILENQGGRRIDLLLCNERPIFNSVVLGEVFGLHPARRIENWRARLASFFRRLAHLGKMHPRIYQISTSQEKSLQTAALGMVVVEHARNSALSRSVLPETNINDGTLHALVLAPRSLLDMFRFLLMALIRADRHGGRRMAPFIGHIRSAGLQVSSTAPIDYLHDGAWLSSQELVFDIHPQALRLIPGRHLEIDEGVESAKESWRVASLPSPEASAMLTSKPLPWLPKAATEEFRDLYQILRDNAQPTAPYLTLMVLSTLLAAIGLFANSTPVIIGAMILAPMMAPIVSLAMAVLRQDVSLLRNSARTLLYGMVLALGFSALAGWLMPMRVITPEIAARLSPTLLDLGVAVISGCAGAYAHAREEIAKSLAGVAIAVALVPPLAVAGIGIGWLDWSILWGAMLLFLTNLAGMLLMAGLTFLLLGYAPFERARKGLLATLIIVCVLCIPLALGFARMTKEQSIVRALEGKIVESVTIRNVVVRSGDPVRLSMRLVAPSAIDDEAINRIKAAIEDHLGYSVELETTMGVRR